MENTNRVLTQKDKWLIDSKRLAAKIHHRIPKDFLYDSQNKELFYDEFSDVYYWSTKTALIAAELAINRELSFRGEVFVSTFYDIIGCDAPEIYRRCGWNTELQDEQWIDVDHIFIDGAEVEEPRSFHMIVFMNRPEQIR